MQVLATLSDQRMIVNPQGIGGGEGSTNRLTCHTTTMTGLACNENCPLCYVSHQIMGIFAFLPKQKPLILDVQKVHLKVDPDFLLLATNI